MIKLGKDQNDPGKLKNQNIVSFWPKYWYSVS